MRTTEKKYWINGYTKRYGFTRKKACKILTFNVSKLGIMISNLKPYLELYSLTK